MMLIRKIACLAFILGAGLIPGGCSTPGPGGNPLAGPWEYAIGDLRDGVAEGERRVFRPVRDLTRLERFFPGGKGTLWLRKIFVVQDTGRYGRPSILLGTIIPVDETYLNGEFIGGCGSFPYGENNFFSEWNTFRKYDVPASLLKRGENRLLVKIYACYEASLNGVPILGDRSALTVIYRFEDFIRYHLNMIVAFLTLATALFLFIIFLKNTRALENLYLAATCVLFSFYIMNFFIVRIPGGIDQKVSYFLVQKIVYGLPCVSFLFLIKFVDRFLGEKPGRAAGILKLCATLLPVLLIFLLPDYRSIVRYGKLLLSVSAGVSIAYVFGVSLARLRENDPDARYFVAGFLPVMAAIIFDAVTHVALRRNDIIYISGIGVAGYIIFIAFILANRLVNYYRRAEHLNDELARKIAAQMKVEDELSSEKEMLAVTINSIAEAVIATDILGRVIIINRVAEEMCGVTAGETAGTLVYGDTGGKNSRMAEIFSGVFERISRSEDRIDIGLRTLFSEAGGEKRQLLGSGAPIRDREHHAIGYVFVFRDITGDLRLQNEILKIKKLESIGILAGGIAHDFNNILTAILGNINLAKLLLERESEPARLMVDAEEAIIRAQGLTRQLLTFARGGAPVKQVSSVQELVRDSTDFVLRGSNVKCVFEFPDDLWPASVDVGQFSQVIQNLVINADQAMPGGGEIIIRTENAVIDERDGVPLRAGKYVRISVTDSGTGIDPRHLPKIFDPYFTTKEGGSGLGLASSYSIIKKHDGHIEAASRPGGGAVFTIYLPSSEREVARGAYKSTDISRIGGRVLLMDDDENVGKTVKKMLRHLGMMVTLAKNGDEAIEIFKMRHESAEPFSLVILDLTIPGGIGGREVLERLIEIDPDVSAIVSSGYSTDAVMANYEQYGFKGVISKPYRLEELSEVIRNLLKAR
jgi:PAS domain S-box-containing protein